MEPNPLRHRMPAPQVRLLIRVLITTADSTHLHIIAIGKRRIVRTRRAPPSPEEYACRDAQHCYSANRAKDHRWCARSTGRAPGGRSGSARGRRAGGEWRAAPPLL
ncbi:hypothetical protein BDZ89DRAFT_1077635, partial [Hymenopellis radicata]